MKLSTEIAFKLKHLLKNGRDAILGDCRRLGVKGQRGKPSCCLLANWCKANGASHAEFRNTGVTIFGEKNDFSDLVDIPKPPRLIQEIMNDFDSGYLEEFEQA